MPLERANIKLSSDLMLCIRYCCEQIDPGTGKAPQMGPLIESILRRSKDVKEAAKILGIKFDERLGRHDPTTDIELDREIFELWALDSRPVGRKGKANDTEHKTMGAMATARGISEEEFRAAVLRHRSRLRVIEIADRNDRARRLAAK